MRHVLLFVVLVVCLVSACADFTTDPTSGNASGTIQYCPDAQDAIAISQGLPVPYPSNPSNPTPYDPALPPPIFFHPCVAANGAQTYRNGVPCVVCSVDDYHADLAPGSFACIDAKPDGTAIVCVAPFSDGRLDVCNPALNGCQ